MGQINPKDPSLLTDEDIEYSKFSCCGDEDLVFLRCFGCKHIWVECYECSTWYTDLNNLDTRQHCFLTSDDQRLNCPSCDRQFEDSLYLSDQHCDKYLATKAQVIQAGHLKFLKPELRPKAPQIRTTPQRFVYGPLIGGSIGAAGWLLGMSAKAMLIGHWANSVFPMIAAIFVMLTGAWIGILKSRGEKVRIWTAMQILLFVSALFGTLACLTLHFRSGLDPLIDPKGHYPTWVNFLAPICIVFVMAFLYIPLIRKMFYRTYL